MKVTRVEHKANSQTYYVDNVSELILPEMVKKQTDDADDSVLYAEDDRPLYKLRPFNNAIDYKAGEHCTQNGYLQKAKVDIPIGASFDQTQWDKIGANLALIPNWSARNYIQDETVRFAGFLFVCNVATLTSSDILAELTAGNWKAFSQAEIENVTGADYVIRFEGKPHIRYYREESALAGAHFTGYTTGAVAEIYYKKTGGGNANLFKSTTASADTWILANRGAASFTSIALSGAANSIFYIKITCLDAGAKIFLFDISTFSVPIVNQAFGSSWAADTTNAPTRKNIYDKIATMDSAIAAANEVCDRPGVSVDGQTTLFLSGAITNPDKTKVFVNGIKYEYPEDWYPAPDPTQILWVNPLTLETTDYIAVYRS